MKYKNFFEDEVPGLISNLDEVAQPSFGLMTAQHMVEHLIWITKASIKDMGPAPEELSKSQQGFMKFIDKGAEFKYRPSDKTEHDLPPLKYESLQVAITHIPEAIQRMYNAMGGKSDGESFFNPMMGVLSPEQLEFFHMKHYKWHLENQFALNPQS